MNRLKKNQENIKELNKAIKEQPNGVEEIKAAALMGILHILEDISISLAEIADLLDSEVNG